MALSRDCKEKLLQTLTGRISSISVANDCYIGLLYAEPEYRIDQDPETGTYSDPYMVFTEVDKQGYERVLIGTANGASSHVMSKADTNGTSSNTLNVMFPEAETDWGSVTHFALFNKKEGGEPHLWGALTTPVNISTGYVALFKPGALSITLT